MVCTLTQKEGLMNWCERHQMQHLGHYAEYAVTEGEKFDSFRALWDRMRDGTHQSMNAPQPRLLRSLPMAKMCKHLGNEKPKKEGCQGCSNWACNVRGETTLAYCSQECRQWEREKPNPTSKEIKTRNLLYHIYPVSNGIWRWNTEQLCGRLKAFNGKKIVAIVTDPPTGRLPDPIGPNCPDSGRHIPGCDSAEMVKAEFAKRWPYDDIEFIEMENDPSLREVKTLIPMLERVLSDDYSQITLYAQAKGTTRHNGHIARRWTEALYEIMFDYFPLAEEQLMTYPVTGCFKKLGAGWSPDQSHSDWHWSGSWAYFRNAELFTRDWQRIDAFWSGVEPYWSQHFRADEAGCLFHTAQVPVMNLYNQGYWRRVIIPAFDKWRIDNAKYRTDLWPR